jgi:hypothetical protein
MQTDCGVLPYVPSVAIKRCQLAGDFLFEMSVATGLSINIRHTDTSPTHCFALFTEISSRAMLVSLKRIPRLFLGLLEHRGNGGGEASSV